MPNSPEDEATRNAIEAATIQGVVMNLELAGLCRCPACVAGILGGAIVDVAEAVAHVEGLAKGLGLLSAIAADLSATEVNNTAPSTGTMQ